jgi:hypothetical protein
VGNAYEDAQGRIVLDAVLYDHDGFQHTWSDIGGPTGPGGFVGVKEPGHSQAPSVLHRWTIDPAVKCRSGASGRMSLPCHPRISWICPLTW